MNDEFSPDVERRNLMRRTRDRELEDMAREARDKAMEALAGQSRHEEICALRYKGIVDEQKLVRDDLKGIQKLMLGVLLTLSGTLALIILNILLARGNPPGH